MVLSKVTGPPASAAPGNSLELQIPGPTPDYLNGKFWGWDPEIYVFSKPSG